MGPSAPPFSTTCSLLPTLWPPVRRQRPSTSSRTWCRPASDDRTRAFLLLSSSSLSLFLLCVFFVFVRRGWISGLPSQYGQAKGAETKGLNSLLVAASREGPSSDQRR